MSTRRTSSSGPARTRPRRSAGPWGFVRALFSVHGFAVFAMVLQVLFTADHLGATLAAESGRAAPGERLGLLEICTGEGIVLMTPDGRVVSTGASGSGGHSGAQTCPVCASASVCHFAAPDGAAVPILQAALIAPLDVSPMVVAIHVPARPNVTPIRAPPAV